MSAYKNQLEKLTTAECQECCGTGICNNGRKPSELLYWDCVKCNGTGFKDGKYHSSIIINKPPKGKDNEPGQSTG